MKSRSPLLPRRARAALLAGAALALVAPPGAFAQEHAPTPPPDCVAAGGEDADGNGLDDALVSIRARIFDSEISCDARIGPDTIVNRARVVPATDGPESVSPAIGARGFIGEGALVEGAVLGNAVIVLGGAEIVSTLNSQVFIDDRVFIGRDAVVSGGNSDAEIGRHSAILRGATIRGGRLGPRLVLGPEASLNGVDVGRNVRIGARTTIGFESGIDRGTRIGSDVSIGTAFIGRRSVIGDGTTIGSADIGKRATIGENVSIESASIGERVTIGDGATIGRGVELADGAVVAPGEVVPDAF